MSCSDRPLETQTLGKIKVYYRHWNEEMERFELDDSPICEADYSKASYNATLNISGFAFPKVGRVRVDAILDSDGTPIRMEITDER